MSNKLNQYNLMPKEKRELQDTINTTFAVNVYCDNLQAQIRQRKLNKKYRQIFHPWYKVLPLKFIGLFIKKKENAEIKK